MKILGVGLSKTGTSSLHKALEILGLKCIHYDTVRLNDILDGSNPSPTFRRYDDIDAVTDIPAAFFYRELLAAYPESKAILTIRPVDSWWHSVSTHFNIRFPVSSRAARALIKDILRQVGLCNKFDDEVFRIALRNCIYGSNIAHEFLYKKKYLEHNERVQADIPLNRLLVMDITAGDGWEVLCPFLGMPTPQEPFPHMNRTPVVQSKLNEQCYVGAERHRHFTH